MKYEYFVSFHAFNKDGTYGCGNTSVTSDEKWKELGDIRLTEKTLIDDNHTIKNIIITNFILLKETEDE